MTILRRTTSKTVPSSATGRRAKGTVARTDYMHEIFISYKREENWTPWVRQFASYLKSYLQQDLGFEPRIFIDERIEGGSDWVTEIAYNLATSKVVIPLFSKDYFSSHWCIHELDLMMERALHSGSNIKNQCKLIIPALVHDGEIIPSEVNRTQLKDFKEFRTIGICPGTEKFLKYSETLKAFSIEVTRALSSAPSFDVRWIEHHVKRLNEVYGAISSGKVFEPVNFKVQRNGQLGTLPRLKLQMGAP